MSSTTMMGSASAEGKEERIFKVFAYLNTKDDFEPLKVIERVNVGAKKPVEPKTIYSYLLASYGGKCNRYTLPSEIKEAI